MNRRLARSCLAAALLSLFAATIPAHARDTALLPGMLPLRNPTGFAATYSTMGGIPLDGPFFQSLGTNGRSCASCHQPGDGWTVTPEHLRERFDATAGLDPVFRTNDGSNSPAADVSNVEARRKAYSMLLDKGLIRVGIAVPPDAEFELIAADDPYGYASAAELSLFRRPLPSTNLMFLNTVMWDGRETFTDAASPDCIRNTATCFAPLHFDLADQASSATTGHAQAVMPLSAEQREAIVAFESTLFTAQVFDDGAGHLGARHAYGGPEFLAQMPTYFGINDAVFGDYRTGAAFDPVVFRLYAAWGPGAAPNDRERGRNAARAAVARGETLFNTRPVRIEGVKGLNDELGAPTIVGTCTTCHDAPGAGNHSVPAPLDLGLTDASRRTPDMPLYTLRRKAAPDETIQTTDPGRAMITGKWKDIGRFKGPILRGLAARAPYFHNGFAKDLDAVVDFYNERFSLGLTGAEHADLVAFLRTL
jgi:cytochrome c peroxidase